MELGLKLDLELGLQLELELGSELGLELGSEMGMELELELGLEQGLELQLVLDRKSKWENKDNFGSAILAYRDILHSSALGHWRKYCSHFSYYNPHREHSGRGPFLGCTTCTAHHQSRLLRSL